MKSLLPTPLKSQYHKIKNPNFFLFFIKSVLSVTFVTLRFKIRLTARMEGAKLRPNKLDTLETFYNGMGVHKYAVTIKYSNNFCSIVKCITEVKCSDIMIYDYYTDIVSNLKIRFLLPKHFL